MTSVRIDARTNLHQIHTIALILRKTRVLITPRGPDPVFYGIRGENIRSSGDTSNKDSSNKAETTRWLYDLQIKSRNWMII